MDKTDGGGVFTSVAPVCRLRPGNGNMPWPCWSPYSLLSAHVKRKVLKWTSWAARKES